MNRLTIQKSALLDNAAFFINRLNHPIMPIVKAEGYGVGASSVLESLKPLNLPLFGLSFLQEAYRLREKGFSENFLILNHSENETDYIVEQDFRVVCSRIDELFLLEKAAKKQQKQIYIHLNIDTGMGRLGFHPDELLSCLDKIKTSQNLILDGVMSHFSSADIEEEDNYTLMQKKQFDHCLKQISQSTLTPQWIHICNTSAASRFGFQDYNLSRIGLGLYGVGSSFSLKNVLQLSSKIVHIKEIEKDCSISYGRQYRTHKKERIATLPIGYFDGLQRRYGPKGHVKIHGVEAPIVGAICMDFCMVNISHIPQAKIGDSVEIFSSIEDIENLAQAGGTIAYELLTGLGPRIERSII